MKKIRFALLALFLLCGQEANAETCDRTYQSLKFFLVKIAFNTVGCYYGDISKDVYYAKRGNYKPVSGPWQGASDPYTLGCLSSDNTECVFDKPK